MNKVETTLFTEAVGNSPTARVLDILTTGRGFSYSLSDMVRAAQVSWATVHEVIPRLEKQGIIKHTRDLGRAKLYQINNDNEIAQALINLSLKVQNDYIDNVVAKKYGVKVKA
jgi:Fe2+ or Zn2+ uptake regulation protein